MLLFFQVDPVKIAEEVAKNIPEPITPAQTYVFGLLVISGYLIAAGVAYYFIKKEQRSEQRAAINKDKDDLLTREAIAAMTTAANSIQGFTQEAAQIRQNMNDINLSLNNINLKLDK